MSGPYGRYNEWTDARKQTVRDLWASGYSASQIADQFNVPTITRASVMGIVHRNRYVQPLKKQPQRPRKPRNSYSDVSNTITEIVVPLVPVEFLGIALQGLQDDQCRFPRGDAVPYLFCGQPKLFGSSYCPSCRRLTVTRVTQAERESRNRQYYRGAAA